MDKLITIDEQGRVLTLYADDLPDLGMKYVCRASHVEWLDAIQAWVIKLSNDPANGVLAGKYLASGHRTVADFKLAWHFNSRSLALATEVEFITRNILEGHQHA